MPTKMSDTTQKQEGFFFSNFVKFYQKIGECFQKLSQEISQIYYTMEGKNKIK
jgi:hypothetical protein